MQAPDGNGTLTDAVDLTDELMTIHIGKILAQGYGFDALCGKYLKGDDWFIAGNKQLVAKNQTFCDECIGMEVTKKPKEVKS